jgi:hypothetical protein
MKTKTNAGLVLLLLTLLILLYFRSAQIEKERVKTEAERRVVVDNVLKILSGPDGKISTNSSVEFFKTIGVNPRVIITPNRDGSFSVNMESLVVSKEQLERYAAENVRWIEDEK